MTRTATEQQKWAGNDLLPGALRTQAWEDMNTSAKNCKYTRNFDGHKTVLPVRQ